MLILGEAVQVWGQGICGKSPYLLFHFVVNLKLFFKNNLKKKKVQISEKIWLTVSDLERYAMPTNLVVILLLLVCFLEAIFAF